MEWARTLRINAPPSDELQDRISGRLSREGMTLRFAGSRALKRTYVLLEGPQGVDPGELDKAELNARSFPEPIIALAIEPEPADALPLLARALGGPGAPAGVYSCDIAGERVIVEFAPGRTAAATVFALADAELRRFSGRRNTKLLSPLPDELWARVAADGLGAPEIAPDRILETLLSAADVE